MTYKEATHFLFLDIALILQNKEETLKHGCVKVQLAMKELL